MEILDRITVALQKETVTIVKICYYFDKVISHFWELGQCREEDAPTVRDVAFESGIKNMQQRRRQDFSEAKAAIVEHLQKGPKHTTLSGDSELLLAKIANTQFHKRENRRSKYIDLQFLLPTSNYCERPFYVACSPSTDIRKSMCPTTFGTLMFLY